MSKEKINLNISGMTCVNCSNGIEKFISKQKGIKECHVSFASSEGEFIFDNSIILKDAIVSNIKKLGYSVEENIMALEKEQQKSFIKLKQLVISASIITTLMFILMFGSFFESNTNKYILFFLASIVQFYCGARFYSLAYKAVSNKNYDMNVLVALGTSAAYIYSTLVVFTPTIFPENLRFIYFDGAAIIITFVLLGRYLEENSKLKASDFLKKLMHLTPLNANLLINNDIKVVLASTLKIDDMIIVKAGEQIPIDGIIKKGKADIDTSMLTGESIPILKQEKDEVFAGTLNTSGVITLKVTKQSKDTTLSNIITLLKSAQSKQIPISRYADKIANIFVPSVILIALITFITWGMILGNYENAIFASISVLIISCPCALGLATPIAIVSAVSSGAEKGILIKNPEILEVIKDIKYAVFDKTGTLTKGIICVTNTNIDSKYFNVIGSIELLSEHPISKAIVDYIKVNQYTLDTQIDNIKIHTGKGIEAVVNGDTIIIGNLNLLQEKNIPIDQINMDFFNTELLKSNGAVLVSINRKCIGVFSLEDEIKEDAIETIHILKEKEIIPILLTGDNNVTAKKIANKLGIEKIYSEVLPNEKYDVIKKLQEKDKVMFIGDGINDAPSIKQADIGITLNSGSDISKDAGDIILVNNKLSAIPQSLNLSKETMLIIKQNLFWAFIYNALGIPLAAGLLYPFFGLMLTPMYAGIAMSFSSVTVVLNSLRLKLLKL